jgi:DNA (cytosine-5)-methyltransferase 1
MGEGKVRLLVDHSFGDYSDIVLRRIMLLPVGGRMKDLPRELWHKSFIREGAKKTGGPNLRLLRLDPALPSNTITGFVFNKFVHPTENRYITPREAARIQGFPDSFQFKGSITSMQLQIGNAVPVKLADAVGAWVRKYLDENTKTTNPKAISLFAGAGGMDLGFHKYFDIVAINEYIPIFCDTLRTNFIDSRIVEGDILKMSGNELARGKKIDLVFGGPPCQAFSSAGKQKGIDDPRGTMIMEYIRIVKETQPEAFVLENVPNLKAIAKGQVLAQALEQMEAAGYETEAFVLNAADYGAAQSRRRLFILGRKAKHKKPMGIPPPTHSNREGLRGFEKHVGVGEVLNDLPKAILRTKALGHATNQKKSIKYIDDSEDLQNSAQMSMLTQSN